MVSERESCVPVLPQQTSRRARNQLDGQLRWWRAEDGHVIPGVYVAAEPDVCGHSLTSVTRKMATQMAMPSIHFLSWRSSGMAAPITVDTCGNRQGHRQAGSHGGVWLCVCVC